MGYCLDCMVQYHVISILSRANMLNQQLRIHVSYLYCQVAENSDGLFFFLLFLRLFPMTPNWLINIASPLVGIPAHLFFFSVFVGTCCNWAIALHVLLIPRCDLHSSLFYTSLVRSNAVQLLLLSGWSCAWTADIPEWSVQLEDSLTVCFGSFRGTDARTIHPKAEEFECREQVLVTNCALHTHDFFDLFCFSSN